MDWLPLIFALLAAGFGFLVAKLGSSERFKKSLKRLLSSFAKNLENGSVGYRLTLPTGRVETVYLKNSIQGSEIISSIENYLKFEKQVYKKLRNTSFFDDSFVYQPTKTIDFAFEAFNKKVGVEAKLSLSHINEKWLKKLLRDNKSLDYFVLVSDDDQKYEILKSKTEMLKNVSLIKLSDVDNIENYLSKKLTSM